MRSKDPGLLRPLARVLMTLVQDDDVVDHRIPYRRWGGRGRVEDDIAAGTSAFGEGGARFQRVGAVEINQCVGCAKF